MKFSHASIAAALGLAVAMGCSSGEPSKESGSTAANNGPVLDGTYRVDLDGKQRLGNGMPMPIAPISNPYAFRSACSPTGCVATGTLLHGDDIKRAADFAVTLDYVDGGWQMVAADTFTCDDGSTTPGISAWFLKPGPNGSLAGTFYAAHAVGIDCVAALEAPLSLTRVGDVDPGVAIADPGAVAGLSPSAPEALRGKYRQTNTYRGEGITPSTDAVAMKTMCVRNTDQCWTLATATSGSATAEWPLMFTDGKWSVTGRASRDQRCSNGSSASTVIHTEYTMPQPVPYPIPRLTGTRTLDFSGPCTGSYAYDLVLERTGD
jgi:hypothetical protein